MAGWRRTSTSPDRGRLVDVRLGAANDAGAGASAAGVRNRMAVAAAGGCYGCGVRGGTGCGAGDVAALVHRCSGPDRRTGAASTVGVDDIDGAGRRHCCGRLARGRRTLAASQAVLAPLLCLLSSGLVLNAWVGYVPTVYSAWSQLTAGPLPDQTDRATLAAMQSRGEMPAKGVVVPVAISAETSKFRHRGELVYLPPAWFASVPPPRLPVVMMVGAEINTPVDWLGVAGGQPRQPMHSRPPTAGLRRCWCSSIRAARSASTPGIGADGSRGNAADHIDQRRRAVHDLELRCER